MECCISRTTITNGKELLGYYIIIVKIPHIGSQNFRAAKDPRDYLVQSPFREVKLFVQIHTHLLKFKSAL